MATSTPAILATFSQMLSGQEASGEPVAAALPAGDRGCADAAGQKDEKEPDVHANGAAAGHPGNERTAGM